MTNTHQAPSADAVRFFHEALAAGQAGDTLQAYQLNIAAVAADPNLPGVWNNLGMTLNKMQRYHAAVGAFKRSIELAPDSVMPRANYAWSLHLTGRSEEAHKYIHAEVLPRDPFNGQHYTNLAQVELSLNQPKRALASALEGSLLGDSRPEAMLMMGLAQLRNQDYVEGFKNYEARMDTDPVLRLLRANPYPLWRGEDLSNKTLFIPAEQGLGDSVMFAPFVMDAARKARDVVVHVHAPLLKFYQRNMPKNVKIYPTPSELPPANMFCPMLSLPVALQLTNEQILATMRPLRFAPVHFSGIPKRGSRLHIGIAWAGDPKHANDRFRSSTLQAFLNLAEIPNAHLFSLQIGERMSDLDTLGAHGLVRNLQPFIRDVNDTAALLHQYIDVVVTVDTSLAHIAGSIGKRCYTLMGKNSVDWRWASGEGIAPWYPSTTMVLQKPEEMWCDTVNRVAKALETAPC